MHPAYSVIFFTVASGAGFGLMIWLGLAPLLGGEPTGAWAWFGFILAFTLAIAGLASSTRHLGHPERAWRALTQWRSSWLSREGVLAILTLGAAALYAALALLGGVVSTGLGVATAALAAATVYATAMIYAQLRTVPRWRTPWTAACYLAFSLASGATLMALASTLAASPAGIGAHALVAAVLIFGAWLCKLAWWRAGDAATPISTPETATGLGGLGRVRMLEAPHTSDNYLLTEMGYRIARRHRDRLRRMALTVGLAAPLVFTLLATLVPWPALLLSAAAAALLTGLIIERWLFFAEAEHVVTTYYDRRESEAATTGGARHSAGG